MLSLSRLTVCLAEVLGCTKGHHHEPVGKTLCNSMKVKMGQGLTGYELPFYSLMPTVWMVALCEGCRIRGCDAKTET